ncbi:MAG: hypothetical protein ABR955_08310 [Verrucomicrobiota bacterium]
MKSKYQIGWIGIRSSKIGRSARLLKNQGWMKIGHAEINNRNGFNWIRPVQTVADFNSKDWRQLADAGLVGLAIWFCDAQWGKNAAITDVQWQNRALIESQFNSKFPSGRR